MTYIISNLFIFLFFLFSCTEPAVKKVEVKKLNSGYQLYRDGKPYYINGAGGKGPYDILAEYGGNSIRTWGISDWDNVFEEAEKNNLTVCAGLWLDQERQGFDYNNKEQVKEQFERLKSAILKYKDHPSLLLWGIGNELDLNYTNPKVWDAVEQVASFIKQVDGNHPTITYTAFIEKEEVEYIQEKCPSIDILGVNLYAALPVLKPFLKDFGWNGPYIIGEWGTFGHWEVAKTSWDEPVEFTSSQKAELYKKGYEEHIITDPNCLGSYVFLWGNKQERTATWYGMFLKSGEKTEAVDAVKKVWTGQWPKNRSPLLDSLLLEGQNAFQNIVVKSSAKLQAHVYTKDYENDPLKITWEILNETTDKGVGGDKENVPPPVKDLVIKQQGNTLNFKAPQKQGAYRLFVYVYDQQGSAAHANIPFYVEASNN